MAEILAFRSSTPVIHVDGSHKHGYFVNVRPCPEGVPSLKHFVRGDRAFDYAWELQRAHGWSVNVVGELSGLDGAA